MKSIRLKLFFFCLLSVTQASAQSLPESFLPEERPWVWWFWLGSEVTTEGIGSQLNRYKEMGYGGVNITNIYSVDGRERHAIPFMSEQWVGMVDFTTKEAKKLGMAVDASLASAWPFGGPNVTKEMAAQRLEGGFLFYTDGDATVEMPVSIPQDGVLVALSAYSGEADYIDLTTFMGKDSVLRCLLPKGKWEVYGAFSVPTGQQVKRSGPGGVGPVLDHFSKQSVEKYLTRYDSLFLGGQCQYLRSGFNDSYEVYGADYTPVFLDEFRQRRGYDLRTVLHHLFAREKTDTHWRVLCDYRETIADLLIDNFMKPWQEWSGKRGLKIVNEAHGSPANWLDFYAAADIPETETFGASVLNIPLLRIDPDYNGHAAGRPDKFILKFASSAAHVSGKKLTASETATWLGNHFKVALSQVKPQVDELFVSGINHLMLSSAAYSPEALDFPGLKFYAASDFGYNSAFAPYMHDFSLYVARCQKKLQNSVTDSEVLLYFPMHDIWTECNESTSHNRSNFMMHFFITNTEQWFYKTNMSMIARNLRQSGFDFDYISDRQIDALTVADKMIQTSGGKGYKTLVIPNCRRIPLKTLEKIATLAAAGVPIVFANGMPSEIPGYQVSDKEKNLFKIKLQQLKDAENVYVTRHINHTLSSCGINQEQLSAKALEYIRKKEGDKIIYFVANQQNIFSEGWVTLGSGFRQATIYDPLTNQHGIARKKGDRDIYLQLNPGQSCFIELDAETKDTWPYFDRQYTMTIAEKWNFHFENGYPQTNGSHTLTELISWTLLPDTAAKYFSGTGVYETFFDLPVPMQGKSRYVLDLGDVRELADVYINDRYAGCRWSIPFVLDINPAWLKKKNNKLTVSVRNLDANRIIWMEKNKIPWKTFFIVDITYNPFDTSEWQPAESGLLGKVVLNSN